MGKLGLKVALLAGLVALWEVGNSWWDTFQSDRRYDFWRSYYNADLLCRVDALRQAYTIRSTGVNLHIDVYARPETDAPVVIINHGAGAYCRLFVPLALMFYDRGYTVVLPDQRGNGFSGGRRGDFTISEATQNIVDVARWSKKLFGGAQFLFGVSLGGAMTYYAAAAGAPADAIACLNLLDFGRGVVTRAALGSAGGESLATRTVGRLVAAAGGDARSVRKRGGWQRKDRWPPGARSVGGAAICAAYHRQHDYHAAQNSV